LNFRFFLELNFIIFLVLPFIRLSHSDGLAIRFGGFTRFYWCFFFVLLVDFLFNFIFLCWVRWKFDFKTFFDLFPIWLSWNHYLGCGFRILTCIFFLSFSIELSEN
jgi:hypothetical protein